METNLRDKLTDNQIYLGIDVDELSVFDDYKDPNARPQAGFYTGFSGVKTRLSFFNMEHHPGETQVGDVPFPSDGLHAETIEYLAALIAVNTAKDTFTAVELGAGYGPWLAFSGNAARKKGFGQIHLLAVEADRQRHAFVRSNLADNRFPVPGEDGLAEAAGVSVKLIDGAISDRDGTISFASRNITDYGSAVMEDSSNVDYRGAQVKPDLVKTYTINTVLRDVDLVDLMHIDIQGFEYKSVKASLDAIQRKVRVLLIATHSRKIEGELIGLLFGNGWRLQYEKPCKFVPGEAPDLTALTVLDGTQVWINTSFGQAASVIDEAQIMQPTHDAHIKSLKAAHAGQIEALETAHQSQTRALLEESHAQDMDHVRTLQQQVDALLNSTSWRISAPLRWIKTMLS